MELPLFVSIGLVAAVWIMGYVSGRFDARVKYEQAKNEKRDTGISPERE